MGRTTKIVCWQVTSYISANIAASKHNIYCAKIN